MPLAASEHQVDHAEDDEQADEENDRDDPADYFQHAASGAIPRPAVLCGTTNEPSVTVLSLASQPRVLLAQPLGAFTAFQDFLPALRRHIRSS
jgi:hypothetical protein